MTTQVRHGDVLLTRKSDSAMAAEKKGKKRLVVAEGEVTGHAHVICAERIGVISPTEIDLPDGGIITHEEHGVLRLDRGIYEVRRQTEWIEQRMHTVRD